jgi:type VI secretion system protein ImpK
MKMIIIWEKIVELFSFLDLFRQNIDEYSRDGNDVSDKIIEVRNEIRTKIYSLQELCNSLYSKKNSFYIIFALAVFCDEFINRIFEKLGNRWPKLQKELFKSDDGGEKFYEYLDTLLEKPVYPEIIYQVYLLILKSSFIGILDENETVKTKKHYIEKLETVLSPKNKKLNSPFAMQIGINSKRNLISRYFLLFTVAVVSLCYFGCLFILSF